MGPSVLLFSFKLDTLKTACMLKCHAREKLEHVWANSLIAKVTYTWRSYLYAQRQPAWAEFALAESIVRSTFKPRCHKLTNAQTNSNTTDAIFLVYNSCLQQNPLDLAAKSTKMATLMSTHSSLPCLGRALVPHYLVCCPWNRTTEQGLTSSSCLVLSCFAITLELPSQPSAQYVYHEVSYNFT